MAPAVSSDRRKLDPHFQSWLVRRLYEIKGRNIDEKIDRFEVVANVLCHTEQRQLDFEALAIDSGYSVRNLKTTVAQLGVNFELIEVKRDHEGTWYSLTRNPFEPPEDIEEEDRPDVETPIERLYRECCDEVSDGLHQTVRRLESIRGEVQPAVAAVIMDACADILTQRANLTRVAATGVNRDRETYIKGLRDNLRNILGDRS